MLAFPETERREELESFLERDLNKELLRFTTAGSVDDGKSTLIGRLLHDSNGVYEDQLAAVKKSRLNRSGRSIDFSLLTDGLRAEREQGITIDVAYRYFSTPRRKFFIADTPGHEQYTRNMATGASTADLAVILVDATKGLLPQTRRHAYIASLLGIPQVVAAINKMDLVGFGQGVFLKLERDFRELAAVLGIPFVQCIPLSALEGDNVVTPSGNMHWYSGPSLMQHLETVEIPAAERREEMRFPIQYVMRPDASFRGFAGRVASGVLQPGDSVLALPSGQQTKVQRILSYDRDLESAIPGQSVTLQLSDEIDLSRGDMLVSPAAPPLVIGRFSAMVVWLNAEPLQLDRSYLLKHTGRLLKARATRIRFQVNINDLTNSPALQLRMNGIALVEFETSNPLFFDIYGRNRTTGSFILIDPISNATVGAGMIRDALKQEAGCDQMQVPEPKGAVTARERSERHRHHAAIFAVGGSLESAEGLERNLFEAGFAALLIRNDQVPLSALAAVLSALRSAGLLVLYWSETPSPEKRSALEAAGNEFFFDLHDDASRGSHHEIIERGLSIARALRVPPDSEKSTVVD